MAKKPIWNHSWNTVPAPAGVKMWYINPEWEIEGPYIAIAFATHMVSVTTTDEDMEGDDADTVMGALQDAPPEVMVMLALDMANPWIPWSFCYFEQAEAVLSISRRNARMAEIESEDAEV